MNREEAYLYDLILTPGWRERYDRLIDQEFSFPKTGRVLDLEAGTGGFAIDLAFRGGPMVEVFGVTADPELQTIAAEKARIRKTANVSFFLSIANLLGSSTQPFDVVILDRTLSPWRQPVVDLIEAIGLVKPGGTFVCKLVSRGSFDEFFSIFWEGLYELGLAEYSLELEKLIQEAPDLEVFQREAGLAGFNRLRSAVSREVLTFADAQEFFSSPLIRLPFLDQWLEIVPDEKSRAAVQSKLASLIDRERQGRDFEVSIRASLLIARRP
ncbi:MAG: methyltransferase domain-containing protein [Acidobacteria bacterium]|nr:methyltransferase domain-containing protein [Acidobacteriota bacterium]